MNQATKNTLLDARSAALLALQSLDLYETRTPDPVYLENVRQYLNRIYSQTEEALK